MSYKDRIRSAFKPAKPGTPRLDQILESITKAEIDARYAATKSKMDAAVARKHEQPHKVAA